MHAAFFVDKLARLAMTLILSGGYLDLPITDHGDRVIEVRGVLGANMAFRAAPCVPHVVNLRLMRGLDYYTRATFEAISKAVGAQSAVVAGDRQYAGRPQRWRHRFDNAVREVTEAFRDRPEAFGGGNNRKKLQSKRPQPRERKIETAAPTNQTTTLSAMKRIDREIQDA
jgi:hypothetical protein